MVGKIVNLFTLKLLITLLVVIKNVRNTFELDYMDEHPTGKQMSIEMCLGQFDIRSNTIIRTGESQAIGGKFLQGLELDTLEKCQRICCETVNCDVYVFEEKNNGYCYLFQCGSPRNFHCKFTRHPNYTSALITQYKSNTMRPFPQAFATKITTQERELINLKFKPEKATISTTLSPIDDVTLHNAAIINGPAKASNLTCGRFEFSCHSGECIAIYNACNGIPQCLDGSDEGPECSGSNAEKSASRNNHDFKHGYVEDSSQYGHQIKKYPEKDQDLEMRGNIMSTQTVRTNSRTQIDSDGTPFDDAPHFNKQSTSEVKSNVLHQDVYRDRSDIYTSNAEARNPISPSHTALPTVANISPTNSKWIPQNELIYSNHIQENPSSSIGTIQQGGQTMGRSSLKVVPENTQAKGHTEDGQKENNSGPTRTSNNIQRVSEKSSTNIGNEAVHQSIAEQYKMIEHNLDGNFADHDGYSERPRGAVLSLVLGMLVTAIIVILITCRLRTIGRRGLRHGVKTPYSPEEDFLVNGMYL